MINQSDAQKVLATVPASLPSPPGASGFDSWLPPQKFLAGGLGGIITWLLVHALSVFAHIDLPPDIVAYIASGVAALLVWLVPPSTADVVKHLNDDIVHLAQKDPLTNVSYVQTPVQPPSGEAPVIT